MKYLEVCPVKHEKESKWKLMNSEVCTGKTVQYMHVEGMQSSVDA